MGRQLRDAFRLLSLLVATSILTTGCLDAPVTNQPAATVGTAGNSGSGNSSGGGSGNSGNAPPVIKGAPPDFLRIGDPLDFRPVASDPDGDTLSFSIKNKPNWATFDSKTGKLSGTPLLGNEGEYNGITISVSDGKNSAGMSFSISVTAIGSASVTVSWTPPTQNEDGTALTDLAGYFIYYGQRDGEYPNMIHIDNPSISTYVVGGLTKSEHYFVATSYNSKGFESRLSKVTREMAN